MWVRALSSLVFWFLLFGGPRDARGQAAPRLGTKIIRIGVVIDGPWARNEEILSLYEREILELTKGEFDNRLLPATSEEGQNAAKQQRREVEQSLHGARDSARCLPSARV